MWSYTGSVSHLKPHWGFQPSDFRNQTRDFCLSIPDVPIVSIKHLKNQNTVEKCNIQSPNHLPTPKVTSSESNQCKNSTTDELTINEPILKAENSSHNNRSILNLLTKKYCNVNRLQTTEDSRWSSICDIEKYRKKNRKKLNMKAPNRHSKIGYQDIQEMMEISSEPHNISINIMNSHISPGSSNKLKLADFIVNLTDESHVIQDCNHEEEPLTKIVSHSPPKFPFMRRDRLYSFAESEDSFIVFDGGSNQDEDSEWNCIENCQSDSESEQEDYFNSWFTMEIPYKKVRFAQEDDLCEIHPMIKWSYAYRSARKGPWEEFARDRDRFNKRINNMEDILAPILDSDHRKSVFKQRYENS